MHDFKFKVISNGNHPWSLNGEKITDPENLERIEDVFEKHGALVLRHLHFYASKEPTWKIIEDCKELESYLNENAIAGDIIDFWSLYDNCKENNMLLSVKCPDEDGRVPVRGAY